MRLKPTCLIVTGRPGSGKTTLAKKLAEALSMPLVSRDEIKEGYVNTQGISHARLPPETNGLVSDLFFEIVNHYLAGRVSTVIEAAFQHHVWEARLPAILELTSPIVLLCSVEAEVAAKRHLQRGLHDAKREFFHGDERVAHFHRTGELLPPEGYVSPKLNVPTIRVSTGNGYIPSIDDIVKQIELGMANLEQ